MTHRSVLFKITAIFIAALLGLSAFMYNFVQTERQRHLRDVSQRQLDSVRSLAQIFRLGLVPKDMREHFRGFGFHEVEDMRHVNKVLQYGRPRFKLDTPGGQLTIIELENRFYLHINNIQFHVLLKDVKQNFFEANRMWAGFGIVVVLLFGIYFMVFRSIYPLNTLRRNIKKFAEGGREIAQMEIIGNDEIAEVAREFYKAADKITELQESRALFLRAVMHELKTPITKGRFVAEMLDSEKPKARLQSVFERLELLIEEFAKIEKLNSSNYDLNLRDYTASDLVHHAEDMLLLDAETAAQCVETDCEDVQFLVDFELFSLALKNLMDNAIKYSPDDKVRVECTEGSVTVINAGTPLNSPLNSHFKPFFKDGNNKAGGLGLGIYIVKNICDIHGAELEYAFVKGENRFSIRFG